MGILTLQMPDFGDRISEIGKSIEIVSDNPTIRQSDIRYPKAGLIVSKKISNKAVVRNKLKRRLRAALQRVLPELSDLHLVVLPNRRALNASVSELTESLKEILKMEDGNS